MDKFSFIPHPSSFVLRLISFGIFWFFITLSVESFGVALNFVIFEYRAYLPSIGIILALAGVSDYVLEGMKERRKQAAVFMGIVVLMLSTGAYARNLILSDEIKLWEDVIRKSPKRLTAYNQLVYAYKKQNRLDEAVHTIKTGIRIDPDSYVFRIHMGKAYYDMGMMEDAIMEYRTALAINPRSHTAFYNIGTVYYERGMIDAAIQQFRNALSLKPDSHEIHNSLGNAYYKKGMLDDAIREYRESLALKPDFRDAMYNLSVLHRIKDAIEKSSKQK